MAQTTWALLTDNYTDQFRLSFRLYNSYATVEL